MYYVDVMHAIVPAIPQINVLVRHAGSAILTEQERRIANPTHTQTH
jgi:hypothetical protein